MSNLHLRNLSVPFFSQRKNGYVWKKYYTGEESKELAGTIKEEASMAWQSCNITSVAMVLHYFGITKDSPDTMMRKYYEKNTDKGAGALTDWYELKRFVDEVYLPEAQAVFGSGVNADSFVTLFIEKRRKTDICWKKR